MESKQTHKNITKEPFYKSTKKLLGFIGFFFYWGIQIPAVIEDPQVITMLTPLNMGLVLGLLGIKTIGGVVAGKKGND